jgi:hypothetical protein
MKFLTKAAIVFGLVTLQLAWADEVAPPQQAPSAGQKQAWKAKHQEQMKKVFAACAQKYGLPPPSEGQPPQLSAGDRSALHACVQRYHDDLKACEVEAGIPPRQHGQKQQLDPAQKAALAACREKALGLISQGG